MGFLDMLFGRKEEKKEDKKEDKVIVSSDVILSSVAEDGAQAFKRKKLTEYFVDLITKNIPDVEVKTNLSPESMMLYIDGKQQNVPIALYKNGSPVIALFLVPSQAYKTVAVVNTMKACEEKGIPAIRFMDSFRNDPSYVIHRIKNAGCVPEK